MRHGRLKKEKKNNLGGGSGIGLAAVRLLASKGARVFLLDLSAPGPSTIPPPDERESVLPANATFIQCDITSWAELQAAYREVIRQGGRIEMAFANAGVSEEGDYFADTLDYSGELVEPGYAVINVNFRAVINFVKLAVSQMKKQQTEGSIVITSSATAYAPEQNLPVYSASKLAVSRKLLHTCKFNFSLTYNQPAHWPRARSSLNFDQGQHHHQRRCSRCHHHLAVATEPCNSPHGCRPPG
jgi:NAD(P)-dependent dehydrogenase (short-subunit alcohol dehydrogenase family)